MPATRCCWRPGSAGTPTARVRGPRLRAAGAPGSARRRRAGDPDCAWVSATRTAVVRNGSGGVRLWCARPPARILQGMTERADGTPVDPADRPLVLVEVRPSACCYQALLWALREAEERDADLIAVTVWPGDPSQPDEGCAEMEAALRVMVERAAEETGVHGRTRVAAVTHPVTVAEVAARTGAELLVGGSEEVAS